MNPEYLTVPDVAELLQVNPQTVLRWIWKGKLSHIKVGHTIRVPKSELLGMATHRQEHLKDVPLQAPLPSTGGTEGIFSGPPAGGGVAARIIAQLDAASEQIRAHCGEVEDSVHVLARVRERNVGHESSGGRCLFICQMGLT